MATAETRKLAAIMFTDMVGFSRQMGANETHMLRLLGVHNQVIQQAVAEHHGQVVKTVGDAFLVDFPSVVLAVQCAQQVQARFRTDNAEKEPTDQVHVRIGIHLGDIVQRDGDVFGDGVNIASRLQGLAEADTICISDMVYRDVAKKLDLGTVVALGQPKLKNIAQRFQVYELLPEPPKGLRQTLRIQRLKLSRRVGTAHRVVAVVLLLALVSAGTLVIRHLYFSSPPGLPLPDKPSIVVLPFVNMSGDPGQEYFSDGITEDLTSDLSKISSLFVIARNSAFTYKGKAVKIQDVGREMGVRYVLEGSVRKSDNQLRITAQLIDATTGGHLWSERYGRELKDIFALQDEIAKKIVTTLKLQLTLQEQGILVRKTTDNLEAYDYNLRGIEASLRAVYETKKELNEQARQMFERAVELDPQYAEAYARLSQTYFADWFYQWNTDLAQSLGQAGELGQKAIALDDSLAWPHAVLGVVYVYKKQHEQAIAEGKRAIALDPNDARGYVNLGVILSYVGRAEEGIELIEKAMRLNPRHPPFWFMQLGALYRVARRCEEAITYLKKAAALIPNEVATHVNLAVCYAELGREEEARAAAAEILRINPQFPEAMRRFPKVLAYKDPAEIERLIAGLRKAGLK
jgi:adenylate cyclase